MLQQQTVFGFSKESNAWENKRSIFNETFPRAKHSNSPPSVRVAPSSSPSARLSSKWDRWRWNSEGAMVPLATSCSICITSWRTKPPDPSRPYWRCPSREQTVTTHPPQIQTLLSWTPVHASRTIFHTQSFPNLQSMQLHLSCDSFLWTLTPCW